MTRGFSVLLCMAVLLAGCSPSVSPVVDGFRCQAHIVYGGAEYVGTFDRTDPNAATLTLSEPSTMNGLTMEWDGSTARVRYLGMELALNDTELPIGAVIRVLYETLDRCVSGEEPRGSSRIEGDSACGMFILTLEETNGRPLRLELPTIGLDVTFSAWETPS